MSEPIIQTNNLSDTFQALRSRDPLKIQRQNIEEHPDYKRVPRANYAPIAVVNTGNWGGTMTRYASASTGGTIYGQPGFFSPVHTNINWQIPSKRLEIYQWQVVDGELLTEDYTYRSIRNFEVRGEISEDSLTGGILWEHPETEPIFSGNGVITKPVKFSQRESVDKISYEFIAYGNYNSFSTSEEHGIYVLDGKWLRKKRKVENNKKYRSKKGIIPNGVIKVKIPNKLIIRKEAKDVSIDDYLITPVSPFSQQIKENLEKAYLLGLCAADGCITAKTNVHFSFSNKDCHSNNMDHLVEIALDGRALTRKENVTNSKNAHRIHVHGHEIGLEFAKYIVGKHTQKKFTKEIFNLSEKEILNVLGGYFDGDGSFNSEMNCLIANNYSKDMSSQIWWMLIRCGISASVGKHILTGEHYPTNSTHYYKIIIPSSEVPKLVSYMKSGKVPTDFIQDPKRELKFFHEEDGIKYFCQPLKEIRQFKYTGTGYDLQIDPDRSYVLSGFKVSNCRFFTENEPKVGAAIDFYSAYPMSDWEHECRNRKIKTYFDQFKQRLKLPKWCRLISREVHMLGDCFPFVEVNCPACGGSGKLGTDICEHEGGTIRRIVILNPDYVEVLTSSINPDPVIALRPDEELINMVQRKIPGYEKLSPEVIKLISAGQPIRLDNRNVSHLKYGECGYQKYGIGMVKRLFPILSYKTKLMVAQWIVAERLIVPIKIVKVGSDERPAGPADIAAVQAQLAATSNDPNLTIVTHHAFDLDWIGAAGKILTLSNEFELINQEILDGMMINNALLNGEGPAYSSAAVGIEAMIQRLKTFRQEISEWLLEAIYIPEALRQGFVEKNPETGEDEVVIPKIKWNSMHLRDQQQDKTFAIQLYEKGLLSAQTVLETFDYDPDQEIERKRYDALQMVALGQGFKGAGQGAGGMGGGMPGLGGGGGGGLGGGEPPIGPPGGEMGGPGTPPGAPPSPVGGGVGGPPISKASSISAVQADPGQFGGMVLKKKTREKIERDQQREQRVYQQQQQAQLKSQNMSSNGDGQMRDEKGRIMFTGAERQLIPLLKQAQKDGLLKDMVIYPQFRVTSGEEEYVIDFAIPQLKVGIEADGEIFHSSPKQEQHDTERDMLLAQQGWTIVRFSDTQIEKNPQQVVQEVIRVVMQKQLAIQNQAGQAGQEA